MALAQIDNWVQPNAVSIFSQPPGKKFIAFLLTNVPVPSPSRVRLDLSHSETWSRRYTITRNPVERVIAQNRIKEPDSLTISGELSAHPLLSPLTTLGLARFDKTNLLQLQVILNDALNVCFIVTPERRYANMVCTSIDATWDESTPYGVLLSLSFEEIEIISPGLVEAALDLDAMQLGAAASSNMGPTTPAEVPDPGGLG